MPERVLLTGGAGFIGLHLTRALLAGGARVTLVDNFSRGRLDDDLVDLLPDVELVEHDLTEPLADRLPGTFDAVYHLAAVVGVRASVDRPHVVLRTNLLSAVNVADWCARHRPDKVFFSSTSEVSDGTLTAGPSPTPRPEDGPVVIADPRLPRASYAGSKLVGEQLWRHYANAFGFRLRMARFYNVYGPRMGHDHVIPQLIDRVLGGMDPVPLYGAYQQRSFCHVADAVEATLALMRLPVPEPVLANVGNDQEPIAIVDLAQRLFAIAGVSPAIEVHDPPPGSPERRRPDLTVLHALTSARPWISLDEGLRDTFAWYERQPRPSRHGTLSPLAP